MKIKKPKPWEIVSFVVCKWHKEIERKITWVVQVVVTTTHWTYFMIWDWNQYYIDEVEDLKL